MPDVDLNTGLDTFVLVPCTVSWVLLLTNLWCTGLEDIPLCSQLWNLALILMLQRLVDFLSLQPLKIFKSY